MNPTRIAHYRILDKLGEGGMGVVYVAEDEQLGRRVALKLLRGGSKDPIARERLMREGRLAARVTHPSVCQVFELGEWNDQPFIALELIDGESLAKRLSHGAMPPGVALGTALAVVEALGALHHHAVVHRDLKPSNIFLTPTGVKLLDFGLARVIEAVNADTADPLTQAGAFLGTPQYAAPEQFSGGVIDERTDLFSVGVILFEMLAGRPPFCGRTVGAVVRSMLNDPPPVLTGSSAMSAVDRVVYRLLAKDPDGRYSSAEALGVDIRALVALVGDDQIGEVRPMMRLAVLPFRWLKPEPELDYLSLSFADALVSALSGLESLVVRSSLKSGRYAKEMPDLNLVASDLAVDVVLTGSMLRVRDKVRVTAELVSVPAGDVWWTQTTQMSADAMFDVHDELAHRVVESLPLTSRDRARQPAARPSSARAFDLYLRGMQLRMESSSWHAARSLFDQCVEIDPTFAPAWAERGRLDRVLGKYEDPGRLASAELAFQRALQLAPDAGAAHCYYAQLEIDLGRVDSALARLLARVRERRAEPQLYAALVHALRYAGLLDESVAAHQQARRLDRAVATSVLHTYYMQGDFSRALEEGHQSSDPYEARVLGALGRTAEAIVAARREEERFEAFPLLRNFSRGLRAALEGQQDEAIAALSPLEGSLSDGEALFYVAELYAKLRLLDRANSMLERAIESGFVCVVAFERDPYLTEVRETARFGDLLRRARAGRERAIEGFLRAGGARVLGLV